MFQALLRTPSDFAALFARLALGASLLPHGLAKLGIGVEGAGSISDSLAQTVDKFQTGMGIAPALTYAAIAAEVLGSVALILGIGGRLAALAVGATMGVAAWKTLEGLAGAAGEAISQAHVHTWWMDMPSNTTYGSYHILALGVALALLVRGSGALSLDRALTRP